MMKIATFSMIGSAAALRAAQSGNVAPDAAAAPAATNNEQPAAPAEAPAAEENAVVEAGPGLLARTRAGLASAGWAIVALPGQGWAVVRATPGAAYRGTANVLDTITPAPLRLSYWRDCLAGSQAAIEDAAPAEDNAEAAAPAEGNNAAPAATTGGAASGAQ